MGLGSVIYVPSFVKIGSSIHKLIEEVRRHTHTDSMETAQAYFRKEGQEKREKMLSSRNSHKRKKILGSPGLLEKKRNSGFNKSSRKKKICWYQQIRLFIDR
jgi:hypothetical protein